LERIDGINKGVHYRSLSELSQQESPSLHAHAEKRSSVPHRHLRSSPEGNDPNRDAL
jgi:hypothetical protein